MSRGSKDQPLTDLLRENGLLLDDRSYIGYQKETQTPHLYLKGPDMVLQRERVYMRDAGWCKLKLSKDCHNYRGSSIERDEFELDHKQGGLTSRCDCDHNLQVACKPCHRQKHVQVRFGEGRKQAEQEFNLIMEDK